MSTVQTETNTIREPNWAVVGLAADNPNESVDLAVLGGLAEVQLDGMPDLIVELIDLYLEDVPRRLLSMREAASKQDQRSLREAAHCLKGSSGTLGARGMVLLCEEIERLDSNHTLPVAQVLLTRLAQELERVRHTFLAERLKRLKGKL